MPQIVIEVPDDVAREVKHYEDRLPEVVLLGLSQLKTQEALLLYSRGVVSFARAAELAGLSASRFVAQRALRSVLRRC